MTVRKDQIKKITVLAMLTALAYAVMFVIHIPVGTFLTYDPKAVVIAIGGMLYGPLPALLVSVVVGLLEMVTISSTGVIGAVMNIFYSASFCCTAALVYKKKRTMGGAYFGLFLGALISTAVMLLWNYILTPFYTGLTRTEVLGMFLPLLLPFNLIKGGINAAATALLYKPIATALRKTNLLPKSEGARSESGRGGKVVAVAAVVFVLASLLAALYLLQNAQ
ncbi:MAG: ECF transporter S component [Oscillospiraceae bacterium]|nr:ECF transporter S component [Oscillospiraceae bacterium]